MSISGAIVLGRLADVSSFKAFTVRRTIEQDWRQVRGLRIENATDNPISYGATLETTLSMVEADWRMRARRGERTDAICIAAIDEHTGLWVGMMSGQIGDDHGPEPVLTGVFVSPDWRGVGRGVALELLRHVESWAADHGTALRLFVDENAVPATSPLATRSR
jgi:GNAT superfamily N-acetyltransferase